MEYVERILVSLIEGVVDVQAYDSLDKASVEKVLELATAHGVLYKMSNFIRLFDKRYPALCLRYKAMNAMDQARTTQLAKKAEDLFAALNKGSVRYVIAKGPVYNRNEKFEKNWRRPHNDIDLWIESDETPLVLKLLSDCGMIIDERHPGQKKLTLESRMNAFSHLKEFSNSDGSLVVDLHQCKYDGILFDRIIDNRTWDPEFQCFVTNPYDTVLQACKHFYVHSDHSAVHLLLYDWVDVYPLRGYVDILDSIRQSVNTTNDIYALVSRASVIRAIPYLNFAVTAAKGIFPNEEVFSFIIAEIKRQYSAALPDDGMNQHKEIFGETEINYIGALTFHCKDIGKKLLKDYVGSNQSISRQYVSYCSAKQLSIISNTLQEYQFSDYCHHCSAYNNRGEFWNNHIIENYGYFPVNYGCTVDLLYNEEEFAIVLRLCSEENRIDVGSLQSTFSDYRIILIYDRQLVSCVSLDTTNTKFISIDNTVYAMSRINREKIPELVLCRIGIDFTVVAMDPHSIEHIGIFSPLTLEQKNVDMESDIAFCFPQMYLLPKGFTE